MKRSQISRLILSATLVTPPLYAQAPNPAQRQVQAPDPDHATTQDGVPLFRAEVVARTTSAVNYRHRGGSTSIDFEGTPLLPKASGEAKVESKQGYIEIEVEFDELEPATRFGPEYLTYVMWAITPEGRATNLGEVLLNGNRSKLNVSTELQSFGLVVTAEPYFAVSQPSDVVVMENVVRNDTRGRIEAVYAKYDLLKRGTYTAFTDRGAVATRVIDTKVPLELYEARNAVDLARVTGADSYAADTYRKAQVQLQQAEADQARKAGKKTVTGAAREAVQTAEDARLIALQRQGEEAFAREREAAAAREAQERDRAALEAERRRAAEADRIAALEAREVAERETAAAREAAARLELERAHLRNQLQQQLNLVLETRQTARGLIVNMSDVLFDVDKSTLKPGAREKLTKVAGIMLAHPDLQIEVEGHTDSTGSDEYNQALSERRAASVNAFLVAEGVSADGVHARGFGEDRPVATNDTSTGRQQNRRVEIVISGESIAASHRVGRETAFRR